MPASHPTPHHPPEPAESEIALALGLDGLTREEQELVLERIGAMVFQAVLVRAVEKMSTEDTSDFTLLLDSGADEAAVLGFLRDRVPAFDEMAFEEAERFRAEALRAMGAGALSDAPAEA